MKTLRILAGLAMLLPTLMLATGCPHHKGPAERAGQKVDRAKEKVEDTVDPKGPAEKAGRKVDKAVGDK